MPTNKLLYTLSFLFIYVIGYSQLVNDPAQLQNAISAAGPGTTIILVDGTWKDVIIDINKNGTASEPISITAQNPGATLMTGNSRVIMKGSYLTVLGLVFQDPANLEESSSRIKPVIELDECNNCKILNNRIDGYNGTEAQKNLKFKWILADGQYNEIAYNSFLGKYGVGSIINDNRNSSEPDYLTIHHNYFANRTPINEVNDDNDQDAIRIGNSSTSLDDSFTEVYNNYFHNFFGEIEVISNKSGQNKYYNNTFRNYSGTLTLRHGNNCEVYGNYFFAENNLYSGGVRVIGEGHKVFNNYIEGVNSKKPNNSTSSGTGGINVSNGRIDSELNGYFQVKNTQIVNNTFVNCDYALRIGTKINSTLVLAPENLRVANNIMYNTSINDYQIITSPSGSSLSEGNILDLSEDNIVDDGNFHRLTSGSSPIGAGIGNYSFLTQDILGGSRDANFDAGAEEFGSNGMNLPFDEFDIGVTVGFGSISNPSIAVLPSSITFSNDAESMTFEVISNVDWEIIEDIPWLTIDITSGTGNTTLTATSTENTSGSERNGIVSINEKSGGNDISSSLSVVQLNTFIPAEIPIVGATSIGKEDKEEIKEENAYNDDVTDYWTGDPDTEPEVSITFDLSCVHKLTDIGINFWKADERTTTFSISVADEASGPFMSVFENETSAGSNANVGTEQIFSLNESSGRYVKFIGIGNSSTSNWTSIANVNIYGDVNCEDMTSNVTGNQPVEQNITICPVPATEGALTILSKIKPLSVIDVYNTSGQRVLTVDGNNEFKKQLDISNLPSGVYVVKLKGIGQSKFIVE